MFNIVSFCGGGIRGLMSAIMLDNLYNTTRAITESADLFAGTSTGSIIVSAIAAKKSPSEIIGLYHDQVGFYASANTNPNDPAYDIEIPLNVQKKWWPDGETLADLKSPYVLFTAFNLGAPPKGWFPQLFTNLTNPLFPPGDTKIADAVVASGAMPGMLGALNGNLVDGAFVNHDPTLAAIALAVSSGVDLSEITAITLGTGFMPQWIGTEAQSWGANQWLNGDNSGNYNLPPLLVNDNSTTPILNLSLNGTSSNLIPNLCQLLLGDRYVNLNPPLTEYIPENATSQGQIDVLTAIAGTYVLSGPWRQALSILSTYS